MFKIGCGCLTAVAAILGSIVASAFMLVCFLCLKACEVVKSVVTEETEVATVKTVSDSVNIDVHTNGIVEVVDVQPIETHFEVIQTGNYVDTMLTISAADGNSEVVALEIVFSEGCRFFHISRVSIRYPFFSQRLNVEIS